MRALMTLVAIGLRGGGQPFPPPHSEVSKTAWACPFRDAVADPANRAAGGSGADSHPLGTAEDHPVSPTALRCASMTNPATTASRSGSTTPVRTGRSTVTVARFR